MPVDVNIRPSKQAWYQWLPAVVLCFLIGCSSTVNDFDLNTTDPRKDQRKIAELYSQEASRLRQMAQDLSHRVQVYERLFGSSSDWVGGTRLLAQSYEEAATEQERLAERHRALIRN
ncbi:MAG TPA: hypothetical protein VM842_09270 [Nitrospira sp.]|nr:hypothetical protein [Nitrospira sp.]